MRDLSKGGVGSYRVGFGCGWVLERVWGVLGDHLMKWLSCLEGGGNWF